MLSLKLIRENPAILEESLARRNADIAPAAKLMALDKKWRAIKNEADNLKAERNAASMKISEAKKKGGDVAKMLATTKKLTGDIAAADEKAGALEAQMNEILLTVANIPDKTVPNGRGEEDNAEVRKWGAPKLTSKDAKPHYEVADKRLIDFATAMSAEDIVPEAQMHHNACGAGAVAAAVAVARTKGKKKGILLEYTTSHDVMPRGRPSMFVGYAGIVF